MRTSFLMATVAAALSLSSGATLAQQFPSKPGANAPDFTISCFRGPWRQVIWDRPNAIFLDDLVKLGYTETEALSIGTRICRDEYGVGQPDYLMATLRELIATQPPSGS